MGSNPTPSAPNSALALSLRLLQSGRRPSTSRNLHEGAETDLPSSARRTTAAIAVAASRATASGTRV